MKGRVRRILFLASLCLTALPAAPAGAGGSCHRGDQPDAGRAVAGTEVRMARVCFEPLVLAVQPGSTVRFVNDDQAPHVVTGTGWGSFDELAPGQTFEHRFTQAGIFPYSCYLHPGMNGAVVVGEAAASPPALAAVSSTGGGGFAVPFLAAGGVAGVALGSVATRRRRSPISRRREGATD